MTLPTQHLDASKSDDIQQAKTMLLAGKLVAVPTETVYGLGAIATNDDAIKRVFKAKGRPLDHPLIVHIGTLQQLNFWVEEVSPVAQKILAKCWPGPLTLIFKRRQGVSPIITANMDTIAIRMPALESTRLLIASLPHGLVAPSANPHKKLSPTSAAHVLNGLQGKIDAVLDDGNCDVGLESTILDVSTEVLKVLRAGPLSPEYLSEIAGLVIQVPENHNVKVAGNMKAHYQPTTELTLLETKNLHTMIRTKRENTARENTAILHVTPLDIPANMAGLEMPSDRQGYARALYGRLHDADELACQSIILEVTDTMKQWPEVMNRLSRAAFKEK